MSFSRVLPSFTGFFRRPTLVATGGGMLRMPEIPNVDPMSPLAVPVPRFVLFVRLELPKMPRMLGMLGIPIDQVSLPSGSRLGRSPVPPRAS